MKTFRDVFREEGVIKDIKKNKSRQGFLQEALGIWSRNGKGWYTTELIGKCFEIAKLRGVCPMTTRHDDWEPSQEKRKHIHYFLGIDPAKGDIKKADDGALAILRAAPAVEKPKNSPAHWYLDYVWAYKVRKASAPQWGAIVHHKHQQFDFSGIMMDHGGGGVWIKDELAKSRQLIQGVETKVIPIGRMEDEATMPVNGRFILSMFKIGDASITKLWGSHRLVNDSNVIDHAHEEFYDALANGIIGFLPDRRRFDKDFYATWSEEKKHASQMIVMGANQLTRIVVKTNDDGTTFLNKTGAREFSAKGRKDFAYAMILAFVKFLMWVQTYADEEEDSVSDADIDMCG